MRNILSRRARKTPAAPATTHDHGGSGRPERAQSSVIMESGGAGPVVLPTLAEILELDAVRRGSPHVLAGAGRLGGPVRWVHAIEVPDAARLLHGGELVLTTGIALPEEPSLQARYIAELAAVGASGLAVELGRRYSGRLPAALVSAAAQHDLPLIAFAREILFVEVTEAVHARIIDSQSEELRAAARLHEGFTDLSVAGASPE